jgi:transposase
MGLVDRDDGWRMPNWLWERVEPLLPPRPEHPLGCHNPRVPDRDGMDAILLVLRAGMQWNALKATGICHYSSAHRRFQEWERAGVFHEIWRQGLLDYDSEVGIDWSWPAGRRGDGEGAAGRAEDRPQSHRQSQGRAKHSLLTEAAGIPIRIDHGGANRNDHLLLRGTLDSVPIERPEPTEESPQGLCLDKAYDFPVVRELLEDRDFTPQHPHPRRGDRPQTARPRVAAATLGSGGLALLAQPQPRRLDPLVQEG